jgi:hypothetical protein
MSVHSDHFYSRLPANHIPLSELLTEAHLFYEVPDTWHVIITDIRGSTAAVQAGMHETVNLIATGSIVTVLNIAFKMNVTVPFFFGGDGATFLLPGSLVDEVVPALLLYKQNTLDNFSLELRIGIIPVKTIYERGHGLRISKLKLSGIFSIPIVLGNGLNDAEQLVKGADYLLSPIHETGHELDLSGMQCRWDKIAPPSLGQEVLTLLVAIPGNSPQAGAFSKVMRAIDEIYGSFERRQPISVPKLKAKTTFDRIEMEMRATSGRSTVFGFIKSWYKLLVSYIFLRTNRGKSYLTRLVEMSDTLVIDGKINTVMSGDKDQRKQLLQILDEMEAAGEIIYGYFVSGESVMSCYVRDLEDGHIHFVDGAEGGYTKAAGVLKQKLKKNGSTDVL